MCFWRVLNMSFWLQNFLWATDSHTQFRICQVYLDLLQFFSTLFYSPQSCLPISVKGITLYIIAQIQSRYWPSPFCASSLLTTPSPFASMPANFLVIFASLSAAYFCFVLDGGSITWKQLNAFRSCSSDLIGGREVVLGPGLSISQ